MSKKLRRVDLGDRIFFGGQGHTLRLTKIKGESGLFATRGWMRQELLEYCGGASMISDCGTMSAAAGPALVSRSCSTLRVWESMV